MLKQKWLIFKEKSLLYHEKYIQKMQDLLSSCQLAH